MVTLLPASLIARRFRVVWLLIVATLAALHASGEVVPASRAIDWSQVGVPGGIPSRTTIHRTLTPIDNTGATDITRALQSALNACPKDQVVLLPPGTFKIDGTISIPNHKVLRGSGADQTVLMTSANWPAAIQFYEYLGVGSSACSLRRSLQGRHHNTFGWSPCQPQVRDGGANHHDESCICGRRH